MKITGELKKAINALPEELLDGETHIMGVGSTYYVANPEHPPMIFTGDAWGEILYKHGEGIIEHWGLCGRIHGG